MTDFEFVHLFETGHLPPSLFTHEEHIRLAYIYLKNFGEESAIDKCCGGIREFDRLHGDGTKFHKTLTVASVKAVHHFMKKSKSTTFDDFIVEFPKLKTSFKLLLDQHYAFDLLKSVKAKSEYVAPDLIPFD
ncbi:hypothetical protein [Allomuricauda sp. M10]|uniref:hypothetical protein n=1 Tax=Allomuricauda sp. M10 TaxID=2683292 RepID=UPI001D187B01|nr:hypothetical protein [Muricauda sp. M10]